MLPKRENGLFFLAWELVREGFIVIILLEMHFEARRSANHKLSTGKKAKSFS
uniref:Uncharacterized protein n=1 Tax=Equus asinus asinus TaxID=83772 RepID=A0A8C4PRA2_EQUAS